MATASQSCIVRLWKDPSSIGEQVAETIHRGGADALIVSGTSTGSQPSDDELEATKAAAGMTPVFVGSGVTARNIETLGAQADGFIIGTALKEGGEVDKPVDASRVAELISAWKRLA